MSNAGARVWRRLRQMDSGPVVVAMAFVALVVTLAAIDPRFGDGPVPGDAFGPVDPDQPRGQTEAALGTGAGPGGRADGTTAAGDLVAPAGTGASSSSTGSPGGAAVGGQGVPASAAGAGTSSSDAPGGDSTGGASGASTGESPAASGVGGGSASGDSISPDGGTGSRTAAPTTTTASPASPGLVGGLLGELVCLLGGLLGAC